MSKFNHSIWFWQTMLTPHMGALAEELAEQGYSVNFVSNMILAKERRQLGWEKAKLNRVKFILVNDKKKLFISLKKFLKTRFIFVKACVEMVW